MNTTAELAATAALEWQDSGEAARADCAEAIVDLFNNESMLLKSKAILRARAGDRLAQLGDPRFDPERFYLPKDPLLGFVHVPADPDFRIGTRKKDVQRVSKIVGYAVPDHEINDSSTPSPEFYIARYPVTVAQFRTFVETTGTKICDPEALRDPDNRPVCYVSWHEAIAYCKWLNKTIAANESLASSEISKLVRSGRWQIDLPSKLEWEKAARGGLVDKIFSWGDEPDPERANYRDTNIATSSAVGCFAPNGYGLQDMLGNVWEWTHSLRGKDPSERNIRYIDDPTDAAHEKRDASNDIYQVMRGGSWSSPPDCARCSIGYRILVRYPSYELGFRVVLRVAPVPSLRTL